MEPHKKMKLQLPSEIAAMFDELSLCLEDWSLLVAKPKHGDLVDDWKDTMKHYIDSIYPDDDDMVDSITAGLLEAYTAWTSTTEIHAPVDAIPHEQTHELMLRPQTAQRTSDWYTEFQRCLTASELHKVFGSPRERGTLVLQKAGKIEIAGRGQKATCYKEALKPLDWGVCFEPVAKLILEYKWSAMIHECGRFVHQKDPRFAASPDGLILRSKAHPEMAGHLLEIKCPKSRKVGVKIPMDYYYQMQLQMEVTGVRACEYAEVKFDFIEDGATVPSNAKWYGMLAVVGCFNEDNGCWNPCRYEYGPVMTIEGEERQSSWKPDLGLNEQTLQLNTWICTEFHHERVQRDIQWFAALWPKLEEFWADVALAKEGKFTLPDSSRKKKDVVCEIVDSEPEPDTPQQDPDIKTVIIT